MEVAKSIDHMNASESMGNLITQKASMPLVGGIQAVAGEETRTQGTA